MSKLQHTLRGACAMALVAAALSACGGSDNDSHRPPMPGPAPAPAPPVSSIDAFFAFVQSKIASLSDSDEPVAIDSVAVTAPETTEPEPLK